MGVAGIMNAVVRTAGNVCSESGGIKGQTEKGRGGLVGAPYRDTLALKLPGPVGANTG